MRKPSRVKLVFLPAFFSSVSLSAFSRTAYVAFPPSALFGWHTCGMKVSAAKLSRLIAKLDKPRAAMEPV